MRATFVHVLLLAGAAGCFHSAVRESRDRRISSGRLLVPSVLALGVAGGLVLMQVAVKEPPWAFAAALGIGLMTGVQRGSVTKLHYGAWIRVEPSRRRDLGRVALVLAICAAGEAAAAAMSPETITLRFAGALTAAVCAGIIAGRALVLGARISWGRVDVR